MAGDLAAMQVINMEDRATVESPCCLLKPCTTTQCHVLCARDGAQPYSARCDRAQGPDAETSVTVVTMQLPQGFRVHEKSNWLDLMLAVDVRVTLEVLLSPLLHRISFSFLQRVFLSTCWLLIYFPMQVLDGQVLHFFYCVRRVFVCLHRRLRVRRKFFVPAFRAW